MHCMESSLDRELPYELAHEPHVLPRKWERKLFPEYVVIAVDERDPEYPDQVVTDAADLPTYRAVEQLLADPHYVRLLRLGIEMAFYRVFGNKTLAVFPEWLHDSIGIARTYAEQGDVSEKQSMEKLLAIQSDYENDPKATSHWLN